MRDKEIWIAFVLNKKGVQNMFFKLEKSWSYPYNALLAFGAESMR
jgi:hypothetical protein